MSNNKSLSSDKIAQIREIYVDSFPEKINDLLVGLSALNESAVVTPEQLTNMRTVAHNIAGSSGSHGFDDIHLLAKSIEVDIVAVIDQEAQWENNKQSIDKQVARLVDTLEEELKNYGVANTSEGSIPQLDTLQLSHRSLGVFLISQSSIELSLLAGLLEARGFVVFTFAGLEEALDKLDFVAPAIVVLDLGNENQIPLGEEIRSKFKVNGQGPAFVVISRKDNAKIRLNVAQFGAEAFFTIPINAHNFSSSLDVILETRGNDYCRVLLVDNKPQRIGYVEEVCVKQHIVCHVVNEIEEVTAKLVDFKPDLVIIADNLKDNNSFDAAKMIRLHESYFNTPIIFFLEEDSAEHRLEALRAGADDCISDIECSYELFGILKQRIKRYRRSNHLIIMDSLTGTLNRDAFFDRASEEINLAIRREETICLAMIDVDHFKQINDQNGHIVGDSVLRHISDYLINRLRRSDIVGRYAGDEFLVFLPDTDLDSASVVLTMIRKNLIAQKIKVNDATVQVSISLGLIAAKLVEPIDVESLIIEADKRLYEAKVAGRNTLVAGEIK